MMSFVGSGGARFYIKIKHWNVSLMVCTLYDSKSLCCVTNILFFGPGGL